MIRPKWTCERAAQAECRLANVLRGLPRGYSLPPPVPFSGVFGIPIEFIVARFLDGFRTAEFRTLWRIARRCSAFRGRCNFPLAKVGVEGSNPFARSKFPEWQKWRKDAGRSHFGRGAERREMTAPRPSRRLRLPPGYRVSGARRIEVMVSRECLRLRRGASRPDETRVRGCMAFRASQLC